MRVRAIAEIGEEVLSLREGGLPEILGIAVVANFGEPLTHTPKFRYLHPEYTVFAARVMFVCF